jgi:S-DNA-T family DNA segregation ATPase FtsK/SpoIIIE
MLSEKFSNSKMTLPLALVKTISNEVSVADLAKMPHLLVAGATGQGKSVGINTMLMSILYRKHPAQVKLVLIDPKKVELFPYAQLLHHYLAILPGQEEPIVTDTKKVVNTLNSLCIEMDQRYDLLKKAHARNIKEYNTKFIKRKLNPTNGHKYLPFIVLVIDEFADLIMTAGKEIELPIGRLAQLARAVGIHLIIATQRPSVNIITGIIKANFPARLAYKVTSKVDSRTILDQGGAEQLIGRGDMLLSVGGNVVRLQGAFVDTPEVEEVLDFVASQQSFPEPYYLPEYVGDEDAPEIGGVKVSELDDLFEDAARLVVANQHGSTSMIQRKLRLGYNRAGRIMDQLEAFGIVGPAEGSKPREVLMFSEMELDEKLNSIKSEV